MGLTSCVHVIDADPAVRTLLAGLLGGAGCFVSLHPSMESFFARSSGTVPGCVIADLGTGGLEILRRQEVADRRLTPVILLAADATAPVVIEVFRAGALDLVEKPVRPEPLLARVREALAAAAREAEAEALRAETCSRLASLTGRERDVLQGVVEGLSSKQIARALAISPRTVEAHRSKLMVKTAAASLSELVRLSLLAEAA
jgi:two-component system response regulator FixJ